MKLYWPVARYKATTFMGTEIDEKLFTYVGETTEAKAREVIKRWESDPYYRIYLARIDVFVDDVLTDVIPVIGKAEERSKTCSTDTE